MGLKEALSKLVNNRKEQRETEKEFEKINRVKERYEDKKKSANERELIRDLKVEREKIIKEELELSRKMRKQETMLNSPTNQPNIFAKHEKIASPNLFSHSQNIFGG